MEQTAPKLNQVTPEDIEASFRSSLQDVIEVAKRLSPHCESVDDLVELLELALTNDGQLRFVMGKVAKRKR